MPVHRFTVGQKVRLINVAGLSPKTETTYAILLPLPARDNSPQYRIGTLESGQERVASERDLDLI